MASYDEPTRLSDVLKYLEELLSIDEGIIHGADLLIGTVLGQVILGAGTTAAAGAGTNGANTGNGTFTPDVTTPILAGAKAGTYLIKCIVAAANGGTFRVFDPDSYVLGDVAVGATFASKIKFAIADGSTDFIVGDALAYTIAAGSGKFVQINPTAVDGSQHAAGVLLNTAAALSGDVRRPVLRRFGLVDRSYLLWPTGILGDQKTAALAELLAAGIKAVDAY
jgi:hypothetical protein